MCAIARGLSLPALHCLVQYPEYLTFLQASHRAHCACTPPISSSSHHRIAIIGRASRRRRRRRRRRHQHSIGRHSHSLRTVALTHPAVRSLPAGARAECLKPCGASALPSYRSTRHRPVLELVLAVVVRSRSLTWSMGLLAAGCILRLPLASRLAPSGARSWRPNTRLNRRPDPQDPTRPTGPGAA